MNLQVSKNDVNAENHLMIGGVDTLSLAQKYGTPLVVYDVSKIRNQIRAFKKVFEQEKVNYAVSYASKAFATKAIYEIVNQEGGHADVVSAGELYTALQAGFPMKNLSFHGNNKSRFELEMAVEHGVGKIIIDNFHEIELLSAILAEKNSKIDVMLRITPGISAHTHEYDQTGQEDSKFGFDLKSGQAQEALLKVLHDPRMNMVGIHAHIGSQIFEVEGFKMAARKLVEVAKDWYEKYGYETQILNVGGGFGIRYVENDHPLAPEEFVKVIVQTIKQETKKANLKMPEIDIEPGRSIVGPSAINLYEVGSSKKVPGYQPYITVDGGMGDNIRPALYQAEYDTVLANDPFREITQEVRIAGKYCESGDLLASNQPLPDVEPGEILAMLNTGAYGYSMASNYNRNPRPAVVFVENGQDKLVVKRETLADLAHLDESYLD